MASQSLAEQRFYAAVNVIRGLPKNGSYQPSHEMQLRFYSYFKQATEGRCNQKKPGIWNPIARAKWEAWTRLGSMSRDESMNRYVDELKKIIETMSYTDNVADFMGSISELDGVSVEDLEAVAPEAIQKVRSQPNSPFASREASPARAPHQHTNGEGIGATINGHHPPSAGDVLHEALTAMNGSGGDYQNGGHTTEQSDDEYIDTIDDYDTHSFHSDAGSSSRRVAVLSNGHNHTSRPKVRQGQEVGGRSGGQANPASPLEVDLRFHNVLTQLNTTVERINLDVQLVMQRMLVMERTMNDQAAKSRNAVARRGGQPKWWPFRELSPNWVIFIVLWPFVAHRLMRMVGGGGRGRK